MAAGWMPATANERTLAVPLAHTLTFQPIGEPTTDSSVNGNPKCTMTLRTSASTSVAVMTPRPSGDPDVLASRAFRTLSALECHGLSLAQVVKSRLRACRV